ncbi:MAG: hypothetical protein Q9204_004377 [Flavoplaca sp. TL-2023a]
MAEALGLAASLVTLSHVLLKTTEVVHSARHGEEERESLLAEVTKVRGVAAEVHKLDLFVNEDKHKQQDPALAETVLRLEKKIELVDQLLSKIPRLDVPLNGSHRVQWGFKRSTAARVKLVLAAIGEDLLLTLGFMAVSRSVKTEAAVTRLSSTASQTQQTVQTLNEQLLLQLPSLISIRKEQSQVIAGMKQIQDILLSTEQEAVIAHSTRDKNSVSVAVDFDQGSRNRCPASCDTPPDISFRMIARSSGVHYTSAEALLHWAIKWRRLDIVEALIHAGADIPSEDVWRRSPVDFAWFELMAGCGDTLFLGGLKTLLGDKDYFECRRPNELHRYVLGISNSMSIPRLIDMGSVEDLNAQDELGVTALAWAALKGDLDFMTHLLNAGADPNIRDLANETSLSYAICSKEPEAVRLLLQRSAQVIPNHRRLSPVQLLINRSDDPRMLEPYVEAGLHGIWFERVDDVGASPLVLAVWQDRVHITQYMVQQGVDINRTDEESKVPPLLIALKYNQHIATRLMEMGADPAATDLASGETLFHYVARYGSSECFAILNQYDLTAIDLIRYNQAGLTALQLVKEIHGKDVSLAFVKKLNELMMQGRSSHYGLDASGIEKVSEDHA